MPNEKDSYISSSEIVQSVEKTGKQAVLHFSQTKLEFILTSEITNGVMMWAGIDTVIIINLESYLLVILTKIKGEFV